MNRSRYTVAVLGAGPVGLVAALLCARDSPTALVRQPPIPSNAVPRIETVPASMVNFLIDVGVHPRRIGIDRLHRRRQVAWQHAEPATHEGPAVAHIDHAELQRELLCIAERTPGLQIIDDRELPVRSLRGWLGSNWAAEHVFDATGRAAALAARRICAPQPWVARPFWTNAAAPERRFFRLAALPFGYVYRLGSTKIDSVWIAGRGRQLCASASALDRILRDANAGWILEGLPGLDSLQAGRAFPISVQWTEPAPCEPAPCEPAPCVASPCVASPCVASPCVASPCVALGDAALARDVLSSQGIAAGFSSACYAAAIRSVQDRERVLQHQCTERARHLQSLAQLIASCRYAATAEWARYARFISRHPGAAAQKDEAEIYLSRGRVLRRSA